MTLVILFQGRISLKSMVDIFTHAVQCVDIHDGYHLEHQPLIKNIHNVQHVL